MTSEISAGMWFQNLVFGCHIEDGGLTHIVEKDEDEEANFQGDIKEIIKNHSGLDYPNTRIGRSIYSMVKERLNYFGINSEGLLFLSTINTKVDIKHYTDGFFFLPSIPTHPVTLDVFYTDPDRLHSLKDFWMKTSEEGCYSKSNFQSDLFSYKKGMQIWKNWKKLRDEALLTKNEKLKHHDLFLVFPSDFRKYAYVHRGRPENHYILTPYDVLTSQRRKEFAWQIAEYLHNIKTQKAKEALWSH
jgi:hypothetical protein